MDLFKKVFVLILIALLALLLIKLGADLAKAENENNEANRPMDKIYINGEENQSYMDTVNYMGESHEYFIYINHGKVLGIGHWEGCSFCRHEKSIEKGEK